MPRNLIDRTKFLQQYHLYPEEMCSDILRRHRDTVRVQKPKIAVANLVRIVTAALAAANKGGFSSMTLRTLADTSGLSMGSLYAYFDSKNTLAMMILRQVQAVVERVFPAANNADFDPRARLEWIIAAHVTLTDLLQPWFFFAFMEARFFDEQVRDYVKHSESFTHRLIAETLEYGKKDGTFKFADPEMTAAHIKPMLQDWYVKRWKYKQRKVSAEAYIDSIIDLVERAGGLDDGGILGHRSNEATPFASPTRERVSEPRRESRRPKLLSRVRS